MVAHLDLAERSGLSTFLVGNAIAYAGLMPMDDAFSGHVSRRLKLLARDLGALGVPLPRDAKLIDAMPSASVLGVRYVVAGSALGGRVLARHHSGATDARVRRAGAFLGDESLGSYWSDLLKELNGDEDAGPQSDAVVSGAHRCFALFEAAFARALALETASIP
ncbi:MAG: biliverdin-producing heme oxygenase [Pseudomonadota bacterium]